ncbi:MAG: four-carbon acid sugar kinase family protein [Burkholderiales bacterium]|nr:four-carbon acid sugar kinase family protein [Burkholderiales bacterium]
MAGLALHLLADDLTGALDTAAQFSGTAGPVAVRFRPSDARSAEARLAFSTDTRDRDAAAARAALARLAGFFAGADIAFLKVDSLLRGHPESDLAQVFRDGGFRSCVFAPAFPAQNRVTRGGIQLARALDGTWHDVRPGFAEALAGTGLRVRRIAEPARLGGSGVFFCDAASDADLTELVAHAVALAPPLLWCGSAGLARAVASAAVPRTAAPPRPLLVIAGSDHAVTRAQLAALRAVRPDAIVAVRPGEDAAGSVRAALAQRGVAVVTFDLGEGIAPAEAARRIAAVLAGLLPRLDRPGGLIVTGGGTLAAVAAAVQATGFTVGGEAEPGLPCSLVAGGPWDGVRMVSKSGAFGAPDLLLRLVERAGRPLR